MTRPPAVAGVFYPQKAEELKQMIGSFLQQAEETKLKGKLKALIVPHAGYIYSGIVAAQGYKLLEKQKHSFKKVILLGPSHYVTFYGAAIADEDFLTPFGKVKCGDATKWIKEGLIEISPEAHSQEHSLEVQLPFLQETLKEFELYALVIGTVNEAKLAKFISEKLDDDTLVIVSSDLSHYLEYGKAVLKDNQTISNILKGDAADLDACGRTPIKVLMHLAELKGWKPQLIDYRNSGDTAGDKSRVVGYGCTAYVELNTS
ncbi:AmmeMemoRadiSam system protein B [Candidatus Woesearchaeota archaeon]|nr:AmmeMemoRadiSam system protein B [Candidatus Woesearchaeota archaeon]